jgi:hypothetical protein
LSRQLKLSERRTVVRDELASLRDRKGRVPKRLDDLRRMVADTARIPVGELPFLAEVIDIAEGEGRWRLAAETVLGGDARRMLVPNVRFQAFSESIDHLQLHGRITFAAAEADRSAKVSARGGRRARTAGSARGKTAVRGPPVHWLDSAPDDRAGPQRAMCRDRCRTGWRRIPGHARGPDPERDRGLARPE